MHFCSDFCLLWAYWTSNQFGNDGILHATLDDRYIYKRVGGILQNAWLLVVMVIIWRSFPEGPPPLSHLFWVVLINQFLMLLHLNPIMNCYLLAVVMHETIKNALFFILKLLLTYTDWLKKNLKSKNIKSPVRKKSTPSDSP